MTIAAIQELASFSEFARLAHFKPSYITQLKKDGRLVLTDDAKRVRVPESLERIKETADPAKAAVAARHAAERAEGGHTQPAGAEAPRVPNGGDVGATDRVGSSYQASRAVRERFMALEAKRAYEKEMGKLLDADQVATFAASAATVFRQRMEVLPASISPQLLAAAAAGDESRMCAILTDEIEHALEEISRQFTGIAKSEAAA